MYFKRFFNVLFLFTFLFFISSCKKTEVESFGITSDVKPECPALKKGESNKDHINKTKKKQPDVSNKNIANTNKVNKIMSFSFDNVPWCSRAYNNFGNSFFNEIFQSKSNIFVSPVSIALALAMTYNGAEGKTKEEMASVLNVSGTKLSSFNKANEELIKQLTPDNDSLKLSIANSLWAKENEPFKKPFLNIARKFYDAEITNVNFLNPKTVPRINNWVESKTENKIKDLLNDGDVGKDTVLVLINAIYFKDKWQKPFTKRLTKKRNFYLTNGKTNEVPMMSNKDDYLYLETPEYQAIQLPYSENRLRMVIFLPSKNNSLEKFIKKFTKEEWSYTLKKFKIKNGTVLLPKFRLDYKIELRKILAKMGMPAAFIAPNFRKMLNSNLGISKVIHQTFVEVDEKGTEAAAATAVIMVRSLFIPPSQSFKMDINHPFFFAIYDNKSKAVLFMGTIVEP